MCKIMKIKTKTTYPKAQTTRPQLLALLGPLLVITARMNVNYLLLLVDKNMEKKEGKTYLWHNPWISHHFFLLILVIAACLNTN